MFQNWWVVLLQDTLNINDGVFGTKINDTIIYFKQKRTPWATWWNFSMVFIYIFSFFSTFSFKSSHISLQHNTGRWGFQLCGQSSRCSSSSPINIFSQIWDSWHDLVLFRIVSRMFFFSFFIFFAHHSQKVQQPCAWRIIVACMHRWHAKPFICCKLIRNLFFDF